MAKLPSLSITPGERFSTGLIATVRNSEGMHSRHFVGSSRDAAREMAAWCDAIDGLVVSISTPGSIYRDLQGTRSAMVDRQESRRMNNHEHRSDNMLELPEPRLLGMIGRADLLGGRFA